MNRSGFSGKQKRVSWVHPVLILVLCGICAWLAGGCSPGDSSRSLLKRLRSIEGFTVSEIAPLAGFQQSFQIDAIQYIDHQNPSLGTFRQRFFLSHRDETQPMVFYTSGYGIRSNMEPELSSMLQANQILLVHRYFPDAVPSTTNWNYLTIWQAATDQHRIHELLKTIYTGKWISTGVSKGGMTALYYRRFYPDDVTATVAYVAPVMEQIDDPRFEPFIRDQVGSPECRKAIFDFQKMVLNRRQTIFPLFTRYNQNEGYRFTIVSEEAAFEYCVLEYPFSFWQYGSETNCYSIPTEKTQDQGILDHLVEFSPPYYYGDKGFLYFQPLFYQAYSEIGYCPYLYSHLQGLLKIVPGPSYRDFVPRGTNPVFRPEVMQDVVPWLKHQGQRILYIYGGIDPWTAAPLDPDAGLDALQIIQSGANHRVNISALTEREQVIQTLERWLQVSIDRQSLVPEPMDICWKNSRHRLGDRRPSTAPLYIEP